MAGEEATLKDVTVTPSPGETATPQEEAKSAPPETLKVELADPSAAEAAEIGRILLDSGFSRAQLNDLMQAPQMLRSMRSLLDTDPKAFVKEYAKANPDGAGKLRDAVAEEYVELFGDKGGGDKKADSKAAPDSGLMQEVAALRSEVQGYRSATEQANARAAMASTQARYNARIDEMFGQDGVKKLSLTRTEQSAMRALLDKELAGDQTIVQRVSNGNFVDVAPAMKRIFDGWAADKKASSDAERQAREGVQGNANFTFPGAPSPIDMPKGFDESWDATEEALARALEKTR